MGGTNDGLSESLADLRARIVSLEDERAVVATLHRFTHYIDYGRELEFIELFTVDGVWETRQRQTGAIVRRTGREALARYIAGHTRPPLRFNKHLVLEPVVALDGAIARVESYYAVLEEHEGGPYVHQYGRFFDTLEKEGGRWRFRERITEVEVRQPNYRFSGEDAKPDRDREQASRTVPGEIVSRGV